MSVWRYAAIKERSASKSFHPRDAQLKQYKGQLVLVGNQVKKTLLHIYSTDLC